MSSMPKINIAGYCRLIIQFGLISFFSVVFPIAPLFANFSNFIMIKLEFDNMGKF